MMCVSRMQKQKQKILGTTISKIVKQLGILHVYQSSTKTIDNKVTKLPSIKTTIKYRCLYRLLECTNLEKYNLSICILTRIITQKHNSKIPHNHPHVWKYIIVHLLFPL